MAKAYTMFTPRLGYNREDVVIEKQGTSWREWEASPV